MATLVEQLVTKMGLIDEPNVLEKTTELVRLLELRSANVPLQINEYAKIVLCVDIAATLMGIAFDKEQSLRLSSLRKSQYASNKRMIEKLLDLNKLVTVNDICIQLNLSEIKNKADELLQLYRKVNAAEQNDGDDTHPQYAAMAVFMACKLCQKKVSKPKLMPFSNLRPIQWQQLEQRWEKIFAKHYKHAMDNKLKGKQDPHGNQEENKDVNYKKKSDVRNHRPVEDYEMWKKRMLSMAELKLKEQSKSLGAIDEKGDELMQSDFAILGC